MVEDISQEGLRVLSPGYCLGMLAPVYQGQIVLWRSTFWGSGHKAQVRGPRVGSPEGHRRLLSATSVVVEVVHAGSPPSATTPLTSWLSDVCSGRSGNRAFESLSALIEEAASRPVKEFEISRGCHDHRVGGLRNHSAAGKGPLPPASSGHHWDRRTNLSTSPTTLAIDRRHPRLQRLRTQGDFHGGLRRAV